MIQQGIRHDSEAELKEGLMILCEQMRAADTFSPTWRASAYWIGRTYAEMERRHRADWGNGFDFMRDYGDEA